MTLLVITPTLGTSPWLAETIASVAAQAPAARHLLVAPAAAVPALREKFPRTLVVPEPGGGMYAALNAGVAAGGDEWDAFTYLNDDDLLMEGFAGAVRQLPGSGPAMVYGPVRLIDPAGRRLGRIPVSFTPAHNRALYAERLEPVYQHGTLVTRAAWAQVGGFDPEFRRCGDSEFLARLCLAGVTAHCVRTPVAAFRLRPGQLTQDRAAMQAERDRVDEKLGLRSGPGAAERQWARAGFRLANLPAYAERVARFGFLSFDEVLARGGQAS